MLVTRPCKFCNQTGKVHKLFTANEMVNCLHCNGTGMETKEMNACKYCGQPCFGYFCDSCGNMFEAERECEEAV